MIVFTKFFPIVGKDIFDFKFKINLKRKLKSLQKAGDYYPKYILTMYMDLESDYDGITTINVIDWLLDR